MKFDDLSLAAPILKALHREGYETPTPIQQQAIPPVLKGADILGIAQTGTGKTAAFALPILTRLLENKQPPMRRGCRALVLSPTRELASQIADSFRTYGRFLDLKVAVIFGGVDIRKQIQALSRGVDVVVATPGRLLDHVGQKTIDLSGTEIFVLDEADQMLDMGFVKPIRRIAAQLSRRRQNLFFSATMPAEIAGLAGELLNEPVKVSVTPVAKTADRIEQRIIFIETPKKRALLVELFANTDMERSLVFTRTKRGADRVAKHLEFAGIAAAAIHGNKSQRQRERALEGFKTGKTRVLVATDIAARGIDIDGVTHVVNFDLPEIPEAYVHRIGRTARAGASGRAISFCDNTERDLLRAIERLIRQSLPNEDRRSDKSLVATKEPPRSEGRNGRGRPPARATPSADRRPNRNRPRGDRSSSQQGRDERPRKDDRRTLANGLQVDERRTTSGEAASATHTPAPNARSGEMGSRKAARSEQRTGQAQRPNRSQGNRQRTADGEFARRRPARNGTRPKSAKPVSYGADF